MIVIIITIFNVNGNAAMTFVGTLMQLNAIMITKGFKINRLSISNPISTLKENIELNRLN